VWAVFGLGDCEDLALSDPGDEQEPGGLYQSKEAVPSQAAFDHRPRAELVASNEGVRPIIPRTVEEAFRLAQAVVKAALAPDGHDKDPQKILLGIMAGAEVGLPPLRALSNIAIINKRATIYGDGAVALVQKTGLVEKVDSYLQWESEHEGEFVDGVVAYFRIWRKGQKV